ncbi:MAG: pyruvate carboxylase, partial [bacterium]
VPGTDGAISIEEARREVRKLGLPVMLKAEGGGGGRGMYEVYDEDQLEDAFQKASMLAESSFGNPRIYVEKLLTDIRHIEIQVIADQYGNAFAFDERDCSVQRHHQKLIEITPSPWDGMTEELRKKLKDYSVKMIKEAGYYSLATVEFLVDGEGNPYLIEVNTRLQVEHGITECRYGVDLVEEQIGVAFGSRLRFNEEDTKPFHHAIQVRVNCEDPQDNFSPNSGVINRYISPAGPGIRLDSCITTGYEFPSVYDSAAALLISYGKSWEKTLGIMNRALNEYIISGVKTTINFHKKAINHPDFRDGQFTTNFVNDAPELMDYTDMEPEALRLSRLVAEISAHGYNPYVNLDEYRGPEDKRIGRFKPVYPDLKEEGKESIYPREDREALLDFLRQTNYIHFTDTTPRDITQSNSGNRFRLAEDRLVGPLLDRCGFFSIENAGGAHFHVAMLANMTYPFTEGEEWNQFAPRTPKQILVRSTNLLGYKPQPENMMELTGGMICEHYDVVRCFDFLNHIENMQPIADVVLNSETNVFEPAVSLSWAKGFDVAHYMKVVDDIIEMVTTVSGLAEKEARRRIILGLKDMAGVCPPRFISAIVSAVKEKYPDVLIHYHRHCTGGLFVPAVGAAAAAGADIVDTGMSAAVRWYGQGDVMATAAYMEGELGLENNLNKDALRATNFLLKQIMPYFDRYAAPWFKGPDYDVTRHGMPGGATSSSQEGAMKQGYIHLLPYILDFLALTRKVVRYHDVTPGSQITWNTAFLAVTSAYKRGGTAEVEFLLDTLQTVTTVPEEQLGDEIKKARLAIYQDSNDAFRDLLLGKYGRLPLGFPPAWVYKSAFGDNYKHALERRTENSPLEKLEKIDIKKEKEALAAQLDRQPDEEELVIYLNHPGDALKTIRFQEKFGDPNNLPVDVWFEGLSDRETLKFFDDNDKPHEMKILAISEPNERGYRVVRYNLDGEAFEYQVKTEEPTAGADSGIELADPDDPYQVAAPCNGDLWVTYVHPGVIVEEGDEIFNVSIMKQEKAVNAPVDGIVKRVLKSANYQKDRKMVPVKEGELLVELAPVPKTCGNCDYHITDKEYDYCPSCGSKL